MSNIALSLPKTEFFKRSLLYSGPILWKLFAPRYTKLYIPVLRIFLNKNILTMTMTF